MKQTLRSYQPLRFGSIVLSLLLNSLTVTAQQQQPDTLSVLTQDQRYADLQKNAQSLHASSFNKGFITNPVQLFTGKFNGLQVAAQNGQPGASSSIRLHNITSVVGYEQPLIILDGMPINITRALRQTVNLNFINSADIASITFVKDDATLAIYGGSASNGVIFINTKTGERSDKLRVQYSSSAAVSVLRKKADVLSASKFRSVIEEELPEKAYLLGNYNTDWQDVIYRNAFSHDQHLNISGAIHKTIPFRISAGHQNQQGILKTTQSKRNTIGVAVNPSFLDERLRLHINLAGANQDLRLASASAIQNALRFDPTQPVYQNNKYGNYFAYLDENGDVIKYVPSNPLSILEQQHINDENNTLTGQAQLYYKFDAIPGLNLNLRYGYHKLGNSYSIGFNPKLAAIESSYGNLLLEQSSHNYTGNNKEALLAYQYPKQVFNTDISLLAGYTSSAIKDSKTSKIWSYNGNSREDLKYTIENQSQNIFGKLSLLHSARYGADIALSSENAADLPESNRGVNVAIGAHWDVLKESFMSDKTAFSALKLNASYLVFKRNTIGNAGTFSSNIIDPQLKPEAVTKFVIRSSFGLHDNRLQGDVAFTKSKTEDMWLIAPRYSQGNINGYLNNFAALSSIGLEASLRYTLAQSEKFWWSVGTNVSYNKTNITDLKEGMTAFYDGNFVTRVGQPVRTFRLLEHEYNNQGRPIENSYKRNQNGDFARIEKGISDPAVLLSLSSDLNYKKFSLGFMLRGSAGNHVYNDSDASRGYLFSVSDTYFTNISNSYNESRFTTPQGNSRYYLEDASFIRLEYLQLGYNVGNLWKDRANLSVTATTQNAFVVTKYKGQDPEVINGVDNGQYPNPTTYSLGLKLDI